MTRDDGASLPNPEAKRLEAETAAADWLMMRDRGWSVEEQRAFEQWLASDPVHAEAWAETEKMWARLDRADELPWPATVKRGTTHSRARLGFFGAAAAVAAILAVVFFWRGTLEEAPRTARVVHMQPLRQILTDGTQVDLNAGAEIVPEFSPEVRRVRLVRGEAHFQVVKNPDRPFEVNAGGVVVRVLGTAFNVTLADSRVGVLVTEGRVEVIAPAAAPAAAAAAAPAAVLAPRQQLIVPLTSGAKPIVTTLSPADMEQSLAWQGLRLRFEDMPLADVAAEFNRFAAARQRPRLVVDESAARVPVAGTFRADNVEVFLRFLERGFGVKVEPRDDGTILLRQ